MRDMPPPATPEKSALGDPRENFFYRLATAHGEQDKGKYNYYLPHKNRRFWNHWWYAKLKEGALNIEDEQRDFIKSNLSLEDKEPLTAEENTLYRRIIAEIPEPEKLDIIDFSGLRFKQKLVYNGFVFMLACRFNGSIFEYSANFCYANFSGSADFSHASFGDFTNFAYTRFSDDTDFSHTRFSDDTDFLRARFSGSADFSHTHFGDVTDFSLASFSDLTDFSHASFSGDTNFSHTRFSSKTHFQRARFKQEVTFEDAVFIPPKGTRHQLDARSAVFEMRADFSIDEARAAKECGLSANFEDAVFKERLDFRGRIFPTVPLFNGTNLTSNFHVPDHFDDWPKAGKETKDATEYKEDLDAYSELKRQMEQNKRDNLKQIFLYREYEARLGYEHTDPKTKLVLAFYRHLSDFGYSYTRPFILLCSLWCLSFLLHCFTVYTSAHITCEKKASKADFTCEYATERFSYDKPSPALPRNSYTLARNSYSMERSAIAATTGTLVINFGKLPPLSGWQFALIATHKTLSALLLFLFGLGIRNRLRMNS